VFVLAAAALGATIFAVVQIKGRSGAPEKTSAPAADAGHAVFAADAWLDSCLGACRATSQRRLGHLSAEQRQQYCNINCACGMEKMTEPGPQPGQVKAPSAAWLRLTESQQKEAARECHQRSSGAADGPKPPGAP
jgi:hypothetical protein